MAPQDLVPAHAPLATPATPASTQMRLHATGLVQRPRPVAVSVKQASTLAPSVARACRPSTPGRCAASVLQRKLAMVAARALPLVIAAARGGTVEATASCAHPTPSNRIRPARIARGSGPAAGTATATAASSACAMSAGQSHPTNLRNLRRPATGAAAAPQIISDPRASPVPDSTPLPGRPVMDMESAWTR